MTFPQFENPWLFLLLVPLALVLWYAWRRPAPALCVPSLRPFRMAASSRFRFDFRRFFPFFCFAVGAVLTVFALTRPRDGLETIRSRAEGIDMMIVLDLSGSMNSIDAPRGMNAAALGRALRSGEIQNRLETAKKEIAGFIRQRPDDRIGLIRFAVGPDIVCPPTLDHEFLLAKLASLRPDPELLGTNTGLAAPLVEAADSLRQSGSKNAVIVLFTDGRDNVEAPMTPVAAARYAADSAFRVYTVGIGSQNSFYPGRNLFGETVFQPTRDDFDEPILREIASTSSAVYYHAADATGMKQAMNGIDAIEKTVSERKIVVRSREWFPFLAIAAAGFLLLGVLADRVFLPRLP